MSKHIEIEIPEIEEPAAIGTASALVYEDHDGKELVIELPKGAVLLAEPGYLLIVHPDLEE